LTDRKKVKPEKLNKNKPTREQQERPWVEEASRRLRGSRAYFHREVGVDNQDDLPMTAALPPLADWATELACMAATLM
jgi:hypothetical protein